MRTAFLGHFLTWAFSRFEGESTLSPTAQAAHRWVANAEKEMISRKTNEWHHNALGNMLV